MCPCISELAFKHFSHLTCLCHFALSCFIKQDLVFSFEMCSRHVSCAHRFLFCFSIKPYVHLRIIICQKLRKKKNTKTGTFGFRCICSFEAQRLLQYEQIFYVFIHKHIKHVLKGKS